MTKKTYKPTSASDNLISTTQIEDTKTASVAAVMTEPPPTPLTTPVINNTRQNNLRLGIVIDDYSNKFNTFQSIESQIDATIYSVSIFKQFGNNNNRLITSDLEYIKNNNKLLMISWEPWNPDEGNSQSRDYLTDITNGNLDGYITNFASDIKAYGAPVRLRFAHEFNGNWYPWGNRADQYKQAFIYIHNKFSELGVNNVDWVWSPNSESVPAQNISYLSQFYPGNQYVDIIGIDGFNFGSTNSSGWRSFDEIFSASYNYLSSTYNKPIIIAETASAELGGNKADWINEMFNVLDSKYANIDEIIWFNLLKETDWRLNSTDAVLSSFSSNI